MLFVGHIIPDASPPVKPRRGFTLIELLLVIAILGVLAAVVIPQFGVGMSGARVRAAADTYMQAARYARTMALLHQMEIVVAVRTGGVIRVEAWSAGGENMRPPAAAPAGGSGGVDAGNSVAVSSTSIFQKRSVSASRVLAQVGALKTSAAVRPPPASAAVSPVGAASDVSAQDLANEADVAGEIATEKVFDDVHVQFLGYTDQAPDAPLGADNTEDFNIHYRSNGTCRPYRLRFSDQAGTTIDMAVDMLGGAVIEGDERE